MRHFDTRGCSRDPLAHVREDSRPFHQARRVSKSQPMYIRWISGFLFFALMVLVGWGVVVGVYWGVNQITSSPKLTGFALLAVFAATVIFGYKSFKDGDLNG